MTEDTLRDGIEEVVRFVTAGERIRALAGRLADASRAAKELVDADPGLEPEVAAIMEHLNACSEPVMSLIRVWADANLHAVEWEVVQHTTRDAAAYRYRRGWRQRKTAAEGAGRVRV